MSLVMANDRLTPVPDRFYRPVDPFFFQFQDCQGKNDLNGHVLTPAKCPTNRGIDHPYFVLWQVESVGNLFSILMGPLTPNNYIYAAFFVVISYTCFWLQISMFLNGCVVFSFNNNICLFKCRIYVTMTNLEMTIFIFS